MKLRHALLYLKIIPHATYKKNNHYKGQNSYQQNNTFARSLQDSEFTPFDMADSDNFLNVVEKEHEVFTPDFNNNIYDNTDPHEWHQLLSTPTHLLNESFDPIAPPTFDGANAQFPTIWCLHNILNDEDMMKYSHISEVNMNTASLYYSDTPS